MTDLIRKTGSLTTGQKNVGAAELHALVEGLGLKPEAITNKSSLTAPTSAAVLLVYDPVSGNLSKATLAQAVFNNAALISGREAETEPAEDTYLLLYDPNAEDFIKVARANLIYDFPDMHDPDMYEEDASPAADDWLIFYDISGESWYKVARSDLIQDGEIDTAELADEAVTLPKLAPMAAMKLLGNVSGGSAVPAEVPILDEDDMSSDSATALSTQKSIKAYVDANTETAHEPAIYTGQQSVIFPNGFVMKFGYKSGNGTQSVSFDAAFSAALLNVQVTSRAASGGDSNAVVTGTPTVSGFTIKINAAEDGVYWQALGY